MKNYLWVLLAALVALLVACQPQNDDEKLDESLETQELRLRINAPDSIQTLLVSADAQEVSTTTFSNAFNVLANDKLVQRSEFETTNEVVIAITPGTVQISVAAFPNALSTATGASLADATYYGQTEEFEVGVGEQKTVTVYMKKLIYADLENATTSISGDELLLSFESDYSFPEGTPITVSFNDDGPSQLELVSSLNQTIDYVIEGTSHSLSLGGSDGYVVSDSETVKQYFSKAEINHETDDTYYLGTTGTVFCTVCGDLPNRMYDLVYSYIDAEDFTQGFQASFKTTNPSVTNVFFGKTFIDQLFILSVLNSEASLEDFNIYQLNDDQGDLASYSFDRTDPPDSCDGGICVSITPSANSNAPANFFDGSPIIYQYLTELADESEQSYFPNTAECAEAGETLGQFCPQFPRILQVDIANDQLQVVIVAESTEATLKVYDVAGGLNQSAQKEVTLNFTDSVTDGIDTKTSNAVDLSSLFTDSSTNYVIQLEAEGFASNPVMVWWQYLSVRTGLDTAQVFEGSASATLPAIQGVAILQWDLTAGEETKLLLGGEESGLHMFEAYIVAPDQSSLVAASNYTLLGSSVPKIRQLVFTPTQSGTHYIILGNPYSVDQAVRVETPTGTVED